MAFPRSGPAAPVEPAPDLKKRLVAAFREHHGRLIRFLTLRLDSRAEAQEAAQEAYTRLLQRQDLRLDDNFSALLYVTARNIAIDRLRDRRRREAREALAWPQDDVPTPERILSGRQQLELIVRLLSELSPKCRHAFLSYKVHGRDYGEIAGEMGLTQSMVRKYVLRALAHCASRLAELGEWP